MRESPETCGFSNANNMLIDDWNLKDPQKLIQLNNWFDN